MEEFLLATLKVFAGATPVAGVVFAFVKVLISKYYSQNAELLKLQKEAHDDELNDIKKSVASLENNLQHHINQHLSFESKIYGQVEKMDNKLQSTLEIVNYIKGTLDARTKG